MSDETMSDEIGSMELVIEREPRIRSYELLYIVPNKYTEEEVPTIAKKVNDLIAKQGGKVSKEINYGKRRLAYPVKHNHYGYYLLHQFDMDAKELKEFQTSLKVQDEVIRHLITFPFAEGSLPEEAGDLRYVEKPVQAPRQEEKPRVQKRPSIVDAVATKEEKAKIAKGSSFDLEKELGVTAAEAAKSLEEDGKEKSKKDASVDMAGLESKLDEIMSDLDKSE